MKLKLYGGQHWLLKALPDLNCNHQSHLGAMPSWKEDISLCDRNFQAPTSQEGLAALAPKTIDIASLWQPK